MLSGSGATRHGGDFAPGRISDGEVVLLRRFLFTAAGDAPAKVSRGEAEIYRLKDASLGQDNAPGWATLFVQGVANCLMANEYFGECQTAEREREISADYDPSIARFVARTIKAVPGSALFKGGAVNVIADEFGDESRRIRQHDADVARDAEVTSNEQAWLDRIVAADATLDPLEQALADFLAAEGR